MTEENNKDEDKAKPALPAEDTQGRSKSENTDIVERARAEREKLEKENERLEKNLAELRELEANRLLGSTAGNHIESIKTPEQKLEEKTNKMADEIVKAFH